MGMSDQEQEFIDRVYREMCPHLMRYAMASIRDLDQAEDVVQEVFRIACSKIEDLMNSPNYKGWLVNTLKNVIRDHHRLKTKCVNLLCRVIAAQDGKPKTSELQLSIELLYEDLVASKDFDLLKRLYLDGMTVKEIADADGISISTCRKRVQRARMKLREYITQNEYV